MLGLRVRPQVRMEIIGLLEESESAFSKNLAESTAADEAGSEFTNSLWCHDSLFLEFVWCVISCMCLIP